MVGKFGLDFGLTLMVSYRGVLLGAAGALGQERICAKVQAKYYTKTGWFMAKMVPKTGSHV